MQLYSGKTTCSVCNRELTPPYDKIIYHGKKAYCEFCEKERVSNKKSSQNPETNLDQSDKQLLFDTIRKTFNVEVVPDWWVSQVEKLHKEGKSYSAMAYTIYYASSYEGFTFQEDYGISGVISIFYEKAKKNYEQEKKVREINSGVKLEEKLNSVKIKPPKTESWKPTSRIEDL